MTKCLPRDDTENTLEKTMSNPSQTMTVTVTELEAIVDTYGADQARWPAAVCAAARDLLATSAEARRIMAEAQALDALLNHAPTITVSREWALAERIMAAAARQPTTPSLTSRSTSAEPSSPAPFAHAKVGSNIVPLRRPTAPITRGPAAALLAASLVLGMVVGSSGISGLAPSYIVEALGLADEEAETAFVLDGLTTGEDTL
jgi:hypothetical protein